MPDVERRSCPIDAYPKVKARIEREGKEIIETTTEPDKGLVHMTVRQVVETR